MLVCALVGMLLAAPPMFPLDKMVFGLLGIALVASSAAVVNHVADAKIDRSMARTDSRPIATGRLQTAEGLLFAAILGVTGLSILFYLVNPLSAWLNFASWFGYAVIYTMYLKYSTSQNIVLGGLFGAAPPLLGWAAVTNTVGFEALLLVLIIFVWTPPHFWALAIDRKDDYANAHVPMLPNTHGEKHTKRQIFVYTVLLLIVSLLPTILGASGWLYFVCALLLGLAFCRLAWHLLRDIGSDTPKKTFSFSVVYLCALFLALVVDHFLVVYLAESPLY